MSEFLYRVQEKNRLEQRGILRRFSINCYGKQKTKEDIRTEKSKLFEKYKNNRNSPEWEWNFLKYSPKDNKVKKNKTEIITKVLSYIPEAEVFYGEQTRELWKIIFSLHKKRDNINIATVCDNIPKSKRKQLNEKKPGRYFNF